MGIEGGRGGSVVATEGGVGGGHEMYRIWYRCGLDCSVPRGFL